MKKAERIFDMRAIRPGSGRGLASSRGGGDVALNAQDIRALLMASDPGEVAELFALADAVRAAYVGDEVHLRGIVEFSNFCIRNCLYCGLRRDNSNLQRYRMAPEEIVEAALDGARMGYKTIVLQSGDDFWYDARTLAEIIREIKRGAEVAVTLSVGERSRRDYAIMREAGADRYLLKHETADPALYSYLHPGVTYEGKIARLRWLRELGYQIGSGNIVGLPGQTVDTLVMDLELLRELDVEMAGIGPFIPHKATPLGGFPAGSIELVLKVVAVARIIMPWAHIPATTAAGTIDPQGRQKALRAGANVVMPNITPARYRALYEIYPNKICVDEHPAKCRGCVETMILSLGRRVGSGFGHTPKPGPWGTSTHDRNDGAEAERSAL